MPEKESRQIILKGIGGSPGICIGKAYLLDKEGVDVIKKYFIPGEELKSEKNRFKSAVKKAKDELHGIIEGIPDDFRETANILETQAVLLKDKMIYGKTIEIIEKEKINAEWALKKAVSDIRDMFRSMSDPYFRERAADIVHVSELITKNLVGADYSGVRDIDKRVILVADDLSPAETSQIQLEKVMGFVTDRGGITSHTGIIARTLEIPAVMGVDLATSLIKNDDLIAIDGLTGEVVINPTEETLVRFVKHRIAYEARRAVMTRGIHLPTRTLDDCYIQIMGNIELPEEVVSVKNYGGDGIGLYRTEFQYLSRAGFPTEYELFDKYRDVVEVMAPKPVTIRTLDINGDKALAYHSTTQEQNPALGLRGIRYCLKRTDVFKTQLRAILRAAAYGKVRILFPMISDCGEIREARQMLNEVADSLEKEGARFRRDIEVGIMIEVPSAVIMADIMAKEVDFFSIGTNDLIQYSLAIDRGNRHVAHLYEPLHPAILRMIKTVSDAAKNSGIKVFMCGEMAGVPLYMPVLLGLGITELSMNPSSIPGVKYVIKCLNHADTGAFAKTALEQSTAEDVKTLLHDTYEDIFSEQAGNADSSFSGR